jgi:hypothetical protein
VAHSRAAHTADGGLAPPAPLASGPTFGPAALVETWLAGKDVKTVRAYRADLEAFAALAGAPGTQLEAFLGLEGPHARAPRRSATAAPCRDSALAGYDQPRLSALGAW